ncbi:MAG: hypothetical protein FJ403_03090 [Verrucomicrobia bacterium]|nr:hypothetical protein [Verrucomicrobiota bacterium]
MLQNLAITFYGQIVTGQIEHGVNAILGIEYLDIAIFDFPIDPDRLLHRVLQPGDGATGYGERIGRRVADLVNAENLDIQIGVRGS